MRVCKPDGTPLDFCPLCRPSEANAVRVLGPDVDGYAYDCAHPPYGDGLISCASCGVVLNEEHEAEDACEFRVMKDTLNDKNDVCMRRPSGGWRGTLDQCLAAPVRPGRYIEKFGGAVVYRADVVSGKWVGEK